MMMMMMIMMMTVMGPLQIVMMIRTIKRMFRLLLIGMLKIVTMVMARNDDEWQQR